MSFIPNLAPGMARMAGIAAIGVSSIALNARAQVPPPSSSASVYHPDPIIAYSTASSGRSNVTGVVAERDTKNDNRLLTMGVFTGVVVLFAVGVFRVINKHNREEEEKANKDREV